jgi:hypothetical protein
MNANGTSSSGISPVLLDRIIFIAIIVITSPADGRST